MEIIKKNKNFVENVVFNYNAGLPNGEDLIQFGYEISIENYDTKIFRNIHSDSRIKPNQEVLGLVRKVFKKTGEERFFNLLKDFE